MGDLTDTAELDAKLAVPILKKSEYIDEGEKKDKEKNPNGKVVRKGLIESNFSPHLLKVIIEVMYWSKISSLGLVPINHNLTKLL